MFSITHKFRAISSSFWPHLPLRGWWESWTKRCGDHNCLTVGWWGVAGGGWFSSICFVQPFSVTLELLLEPFISLGRNFKVHFNFCVDVDKPLPEWEILLCCLKITGKCAHTYTLHCSIQRDSSALFLLRANLLCGKHTPHLTNCCCLYLRSQKCCCVCSALTVQPECS